MGNATRIQTDGGYTSTAAWQDAGETTYAKHPTMRALQLGQHVVYAMRLPDGVIKIGCCKDLAKRSSQLGGQILGFRCGGFDEEQSIHDSLTEHRARGVEYYHAAPEVMAVVNDMRDDFGLPHIEA